jgi:hypothetical protein
MPVRRRNGDLGHGASWSSASGGPIADLLCRSAVEVVGAYGLEGLTDEALVAWAGVRPESLERHFGDAPTCLLAAYDAVTLECFEAFAARFAEGADWDEALAAGTMGVLEWLGEQEATARLVLSEILRGDSQMRGRRDRARTRVVDFLASEYRRRGGLDGLPQTQFELLWGAFFQAACQWWEQGRLADAGALEPELEGLLAVFEPIAA